MDHWLEGGAFPPRLSLSTYNRKDFQQGSTWESHGSPEPEAQLGRLGVSPCGFVLLLKCQYSVRECMPSDFSYV